MKSYWSEYWAQGYITSFGQDIKGNYTGKLKDCWLELGNELKENSKILDLGTGNGALIDLIQKNISKGLNFTGIDPATINLDATKDIHGTFLSGVFAEALPFEEEKFDAVISQFALEYSDVQVSIEEMLRVLKPKGVVQIICHDINSDIVVPNVQILESAIRVQATMVPVISEIINAIQNESDTEKVHSAFLKKLINDDIKINPHAINATLLTNFYEFILKNRSIDLNKAFSLFQSELEGLIFRLTDLKSAAAKNSAVYSLLSEFCEIEKTDLIDSNREKIGTLYKGYKN